MRLPQNFHLAIIMDGNGRWGKRHGLSRIEGHRAGMRRVDELFEAASGFGVRYLSLYAFSTENWRRSKIEVDGLMKLFREYITRERARLLERDVEVRFIGDKAPFSQELQKAMLALEEDSAGKKGFRLNVAMNYGGQDEILRAANIAAGSGAITKESFEAGLDTKGCPPVDLLVRTSGEQRISNFLLWQAAYAELYFTETLWPDFDESALRLALEDFLARERRYGGS